jgi:hypothetical protein
VAQFRNSVHGMTVDVAAIGRIQSWFSEQVRESQ